jgi:hypothetical protein
VTARVRRHHHVLVFWLLLVFWLVLVFRLVLMLRLWRRQLKRFFASQ